MSTTRQLPRHFAVRRVNPFDGVLEIVETSDARAYSPNGRVWQIQVLAERPDNTWRGAGHVPGIQQFFNFGLWDDEGGLQQIPANPVLDIGAMRASADALTELLPGLAGHLPFPLVDDYECWSLDADDLPVALLATSEDPAIVRDMHVAVWRATREADRRFTSTSLGAHGAAAQGEPGPRQHAARLEQLVRRRGPHRAWFRRLPDGSGELLEPRTGSRRVDDAAFPPLGLTTAWADADESALALDYLAWQAPRLLMLQRVDDEQRRWLEQQACRQALELAAVYRLIPRVIDREAIEAARVEAKLRRART